MTRYEPFIRLLVMTGLVLAGLFATALVSALMMLAGGMSLPEIMEMGQSSGSGLSAGITRGLLIIQHLMTFIFPSLVFGLIFYRSGFLSGLDLQVSPGWLQVILGIFFLLASYPLVNLSFLINDAIPLPSWANRFEDQAADILKSILTMETPLIFLLNLIIIAILPGIGEELVFRGIVQKQIGILFKSPVAAIWISAIVFSAIHFQFEGFLPRIALGAVLGYLYYWTGNLWVPIIAHAFNNGLQIAMIYFMDIDATSFDEQSSEKLQWWMIPLSVIVMYYFYTSLMKIRKAREES